MAWNLTSLQIPSVYLHHQYLLPPDLPLLALRDFVVQVENAEEHGSQQERLLTATQQSCDQLKQQVQDQDQQLQVQRQHAAEVTPSSSFTHQTVYKPHIACSIDWMQGCSVSSLCG